MAWSFDNGGGYLGVQTEEVSRENLGKYNLRDVRGVGVESVVDGSPAQAAGLQKGDVILKVNGDEITSSRKLSRLIGEISPDHQARITVLRNGAERELTVTVGKNPGMKFGEGSFEFFGPSGKLEIPRVEMPELDKLPRLEMAPGAPDAPMTFSFGGTRRQIGVGLTLLTKQLADHYGVDGGALVNTVRENSPAAKAGIKAGDIIVEAEGKAVKGDFDLIRTITEKRDGAITLTIVRDRNRQTLSVTPEEVKGGFDNFFEFSPPDAPPAPGMFKMTVPPAPGVPNMPLNKLIVPGRVI
jgi:serine protease Do